MTASGGKPRGPRRRRPPSHRSAAPQTGAKGRGLAVGAVESGGLQFVHPPCVDERRLDYEEGVELWRAGELDLARDAFRFALEGCGDNVWIHLALAQMAAAKGGDRTLARAHFGYVVELAKRAVGSNMRGCFDATHPANAPIFQAIDGLAAELEAAKQIAAAKELRRLADAWKSPPA